MGKLFTGIRGLMNHVAGWSGREIDRRSAILNDPKELGTLAAEVACLEESLAEAHQQVSADALDRLRLKPMRPGINAVESGGVSASSWCEFVFLLADELRPVLIALAAYGNWPYAEQFAERISRVKWGIVKRGIEDDLRWLELNHKKPSKRRTRNRKPAKGVAKPLTARQLEVLKLHGENKGNMSEVARRMGVTHPTAKQHYEAANKKLGITASEQSKPTRLGSDHLGSGVKGLPARRRGKGVEVDD